MIRAYGLKFHTDDPVVPELSLYANDEWREKAPSSLSKAEHFKNAIRLLLPPETGFQWHRWVDILAEEWCERDTIAVWGPSSSGKSSLLGLFTYVDLLADPGNTLVVMVTNPLKMHVERCWGNLLTWRKAMPKQWQVGRVLSPNQSPKLDTSNGGKFAGVRCISTEDGETDKSLKEKIGGHAKRNRLVVDESQGCNEVVLKIKNNLGASGEYKECHIGNPDSWLNPLGEMSEPCHISRKDVMESFPRKWETIHVRHQPDGSINRGVCIVLDGEDCPTMDSAAEARRLYFLTQPSAIETAKSVPGAEKSAHYWTYIRGRIPPAGGRLTVMSELDLELCGGCGPRPWKQSGKRERYAGFDLSLGGDAIPGTLAEVGETQAGVVKGHANSAAPTAGPIVAQVTAQEYIAVDQTKADHTGQAAKGIIELCLKWGFTSLDDWRRVGMDASGQQGAIVDTIERMLTDKFGVSYHGTIRRVKWEDAVSERRINSKGETARQRIKNRAAELLVQLAMLLTNGSLCKLPKTAAHQIVTRGIIETEGKTEIEPKDAWKKRNKLKSPDELDSVAIVAEVMLAKGAISLLKVNRGDPAPRILEDWMKPKVRVDSTLERRRRVSRACR